MRRGILPVLALSLAGTVFAQASPPQPAPTRPKLVVLMVVDQMRADYVERFRGDWTGGLKRLVDEGAWFTRAAYPYLTTVTCVGHATISTGALPHVHGIIQNAWYDRELGHSTTCTLDPSATVVSYGTAQKTSESAHFLKVPTLADVMRTEHRAHVATVSIKARSAIMLAGHGADAATWLSDNLDGWMTSSAFSTAPVPAVASFVAEHAIAADLGKPWTRLLPESRYREPDDAPGEAPPPGWTRTFPRSLGTQNDGAYRGQWERSPYGDAYLGRFAAALVDSLQLGRHEATDVLGVSFSSPDLVGHSFGPDSQEIHDMYAHLDQTIGALLDHLDSTVGRGNYVVALSADHGVTPIPEQLAARGMDAGRLDPNRLH
jgi:predicted AlkP superfamily pyrophosphatase or phosphodiesterase